METSRADARTALVDTIKQLEKVIPTTNFEEQISLHAITPHLHSFQTTIGREVNSTSFFITFLFTNVEQLWFASLHCVHHWSMVSRIFFFW
jgi:hypothetical protein